jgi:predicted amidohydrolase YtcJ
MLVKADLVIYSGAVFKADSKDCLPFAGGIAVKGETIIAVGRKEEMIAYCDSNTKVYDYGENSLIMPSFIDSHTHLSKVVAEYNGVKLRSLPSEEECVESAVQWSKEHPEYEWVFGSGWQYTEWDSKCSPTNKLLNKKIPDRPVCLVDIDGHAVWLNDCALQKFNINKDFSDIAGSVISRYADGTPDGYLQEDLAIKISEYATESMEKDEGVMKNNLKSLLRECNRYGVTGICDMLTSKPKWLDVYEKMAQRDELTCRINITQDCRTDNFLEEGRKVQERFSDVESTISFYALKLFYDGVGIGHTAWQLSPYNDRPDWYGEPMYDENKLMEMTLASIKTGNHIHVHACGDRSVRFALDCRQEALKKGLGNKKQRFCITHNDTVDPNDIPRFAELDVVASMQPDMLAPCLRWEDNLYPKRYGEKLCQTAWPCRSLIESGAIVSFSTDSPVGVINPMYTVYRAVTRLHNDHKPAGGFIPEQKISLSEVLWGYTYGSAYQLGKEKFIGTLEVGKKADIAVLDKNLFAVTPDEYIGTEALLTLLNGKVVYEK